MSLLLLALCAVLAAAPADSVARSGAGSPAGVPADSVVRPVERRATRPPADSLVHPPAVSPAKVPADSLVHPPAVNPAKAPADSIIRPAAVNPAKAPADSIIRPPAVSPAKAAADSIIRPAAVSPARVPPDSIIRPAGGILTGLPGVGVVVEPLAPQASAALTPSSVKVRVEASLRRAGVPVLTEKELAADKRMPVLDVSILFAQPLGPAPQVAYHARLDLMQLVLPGTEAGRAGGGHEPIPGGTWSAAHLGAAYSKALRDSVLINLDAMTAAFAGDWLKRNPKK